MLEEIKKFIKDQKFDRAREEIILQLGQTQSQAQKLELLLLQLKISKEEEVVKEVLKLSFELKQYSTFISHFTRKQKSSLINHFQFCACLYYSGSLHRAFKELEELSNKCYQKGNVQILKAISEFEQEAQILGDIHAKAAYLIGLLTGKPIAAEILKASLDERFSESFWRHPTHFKFDKDLHITQLSLFVKERAREKFIKGSLEYVALFGVDAEISTLLSQYAVRFKRINLGHEVSRWKPDLVSLFPEKVDEGDIDIGEVDDAKDLFGTNANEEANLRSKINALLRLGQQDQAKVLLRDFLLNNKESELGNEFPELISAEIGTTVLKRRADVQAVMNNLLKLTARNATNPNTVDYDLNQMTLKNHLDYLGDEFILNNFRDLVSCFVMLEFYEVAGWLIDRVVALDTPTTLEARFLKCDVLLMNAKYHYCLDETLSIWEQHTLTFEEELEILYKRAECYRLMGKKAKAIELYREVYARDHSYRLVKIRLQEFE